MARRLLYIVILALLSTACSRAQEPTRLPLPSGADGAEEYQLFGDGAYQTSFSINVAYPANPAFEHYAAALDITWGLCDSMPEWSSFIDGTVTPNRTVHQHISYWVNRPKKRMMMLATRYYSSENCAGPPENDDQMVDLVEYFDAELDETLKRLGLACPVVRSNQSLQPTASGGG